MRVRVDKAKYNTNRYTILSTTVLTILRKYFKTYFSPKAFQPEDWLFPGQNHGEHISIKAIQATLVRVRSCLNLNQNISVQKQRDVHFASYLR